MKSHSTGTRKIGRRDYPLSRHSRPPGALPKSFSWVDWLKPAADFADQLKARIVKLPALGGKAQEISAIGQAAFEIHVAQATAMPRRTRR